MERGQPPPRAMGNPSPLSALSLLLTAVVLLLLLSASPVSGDAEHWCQHDAIAADAGSSSVRAAQTVLVRSLNTVDSAATTANWQPMRIKVFSLDLNDSLLYCGAAGQTVTDYSSVNRVVTCTESDVLTDALKALLLTRYLPSAIQLHEERLKVDQVATIKLSYPFGDFDSICSRYTIPPAHFTTGVTDADYVLYVSATPMSGTAENSVAWAKSCQTDESGRPIAGVLNVAPAAFTSGNGSHDNTTHHIVRTIAHELLHALGFDYSVFSAKGMLSIANLRSKVNARGVSSAQSLGAARVHYNCGSMPIMELEDYGVVGSASSHWKMRNAKDELMSSDLGTASLYSAMTIGAMEDTGFYKGIYEKAEVMAWGRGAGCSLITNKCIINGLVQVSQTDPNTKDMFCTTVSPTGGQCTSSRRSIGSCDVGNTTQPYPFYAQYFPYRYTGGSDASMDYCPYITADASQSCNGGQQAEMGGSVISEAARCLSAPTGSDGVEMVNELERVVDPVTEEVRWVAVRRQALCADIRCSSTDETYQVRVRGAESFVDCPVGSVVYPGNFSSTLFSGGALECPPYIQVCVDNSNSTFGSAVEELRELGNSDAAAQRGSLTRTTRVVLVGALIASLLV